MAIGSLHGAAFDIQPLQRVGFGAALMIIAPLTPTLSRLRRLAFTRYSLIRSMEYDLIPNIPLRGKVLDIGGGDKAHYRFLLRKTFKGPIDSLNMNQEMAPTYQADANKPWPIADNTYDTAISFNTLEHIEMDEFAVAETLRCLKPGGEFHVMVPYLFRVHGSPHDYHRHTAEGWQSILTRAGLPNENFVIEPLLWDSYSTAFSLVEPLVLRPLKPVMYLGWLRALHVRTERLPEHMASKWSEWAVGYYIKGTKPSSPTTTD